MPAQNLLRIILLASCLLGSPLVAEPAPQYSELWGESGEKWSPSSRLPDFSFAGYHFGEDPLPDIAVAANVRDFGAIGDGKHDDTVAFKAAIEHTPAGTIFIPPGRYLITDILWIRKPGIVLRGAGPEQTTLFFPNPLESIRPNAGSTTEGIPTSNYSWSGGFVWVEGSRDIRAPRPITAPAKRGEFTIKVESATDLRPGQRIQLLLTDDGVADGTLVKYLYAGDPGETHRFTVPSEARFVSRVAAVHGQTVTLERALPFDVRPTWSPALSIFEPDVAEVGIEAMSFEFPNTPYRGHFTELGYNAIAISRNVTNSWVRDVRILNSDSGVFVEGTFCTLDGVMIESHRSPEPKRQATGHHGLQLGSDCLVQNFAILANFLHDITVDRDDCRNVVKNGRGINLSLDHHRRTPVANLYCNLDVGTGAELWRCGGGKAIGNHAGAWNTFWNIRSSQPVSWPTGDFGPDLMNLVGLTTSDPSQTEHTGRWFEAIPPAQLVPQDLHAAQLQRRLRTR